MGPAGHSSSSKGSVPRTTKWYVKVIQKTEQRIHSFKTHVRNRNLSELKFGLLLFKCQQEVGSVIFQWETIFEHRNDEIEALIRRSSFVDFVMVTDGWLLSRCVVVVVVKFNVLMKLIIMAGVVILEPKRL